MTDCFAACLAAGVVIGKDDLEQASALCEKYGVWLCIDNTYEYFIYDPENKPHHTVSGKHVVNVFSFSKASRAAREVPLADYLVVDFTIVIIVIR